MLKGKILAVKDLSEQQIKTMFEIMKEYYENMMWDNFINDLMHKCDVVLLCDETGDIHGFSTLAVFLHGEHIQLLFSGDTIVEKEYWGSNDLSSAWVNNAFKYVEKFDGKTYWLLLTKGYKTYKFLHTFFEDFYPCVDMDTPRDLQTVIDRFANEQFGEKYQNGIFVEGKDFLSEEFDDLDEIKLKNKHTSFFLEKNPNYKNGDELVCIAQLSLDNLNKWGRKMLGR